MAGAHMALTMWLAAFLWRGLRPALCLTCGALRARFLAGVSSDAGSDVGSVMGSNSHAWRKLRRGLRRKRSLSLIIS